MWTVSTAKYIDGKIVGAIEIIGRVPTRKEAEQVFNLFLAHVLRTHPHSTVWIGTERSPLAEICYAQPETARRYIKMEQEE